MRDHHPDRAGAGGSRVLQRCLEVFGRRVPAPLRRTEGVHSPVCGGSDWTYLCSDDEWRIVASHPLSTHTVTLYATPYHHLALQEWQTTHKTDTPFYDFRLQGRQVGGTWKDVNRV